ncbi:fimbrial protein, partial [Escherichia coli]|nr:fimbrial protein [Escherichia coli]
MRLFPGIVLLGVSFFSFASVQRTIFSADVVASACHVVIDGNGAGQGQLTFDTFRKSSGVSV